MVESKDITIGIDESGILSSIGPRPQIGVVSFFLRDIQNLEREGVRGKDHFRHIRDNREQQRIMGVIRRDAVWCESVPIEHDLINDYRKRNMGRHEAECLIVQDIAIYVAEQLSEKRYHVGRIVIDKIKRILKPLQYYFDEKARKAIELATGSEVIVAEEADKTFVECTAAWLVAYEAFKREESDIKSQFGRLGSGHPADKQTDVWLKEYYAAHRSFTSVPHQSESSRIKQFSRRWFHVLDIRWRTPFDQRDIGRGLSTPYLVLKDALKDQRGENLEYISLRRDPRINISIYERRCPGTWPCYTYEPCKYTDPNGLNGKELAKKEMCNECERKTPPLKCTFNPECDGQQAACGFEDYGAALCGNIHANYLICFRNIVKVGQAFYYNLGQRLLEQGPAHALVYAISPNRQIARRLEIMTGFACKKIKKSLKRMEIASVRQRSPKSEFLLRYFYDDWKGPKEMETLHNAFNVFRRPLSSLGNKECLLEEPMEIELLEDYKEPSIRTFESHSFRQLRGKVVGFRGHFMYLDNDLNVFAADMHSLKYRIIKGEISYDFAE